VSIVLKSGSLNLLEPSGRVQACNGIALPLLSENKTAWRKNSSSEVRFALRPLYSHGKNSQYPHCRRDWWAPQTTWTMRRKDPEMIQIPACSQPVTLQTELYTRSQPPYHVGFSHAKSMQQLCELTFLQLTQKNCLHFHLLSI